MLLNVAIVLLTFVFMEGVAWFTHKYIMHGFMWRWHHSHHNHHKGIWERNDLFSILFSLVAAGLVIAGQEVQSLWFLTWVGVGVSVYGIFYFIFHDIIVHRRIKIRFTPRNPYLQRIIRAHYIHHRVHARDGAEAFGFLYASKKFGRSEKREPTDSSSATL